MQRRSFLDVLTTTSLSPLLEDLCVLEAEHDGVQAPYDISCCSRARREFWTRGDCVRVGLISTAICGEQSSDSRVIHDKS